MHLKFLSHGGFMFITLLIVNVLVSIAVCGLIVFLFRKPLDRILRRLVLEDIYSAWSRYILFAIFVVGISGGVRVWDLQKYITPEGPENRILELTSDRWVLEIYSTVINTLQSDAWMLMLVFIFALLAFVIVKGMELWREKKKPSPDTRDE